MTDTERNELFTRHIGLAAATAGLMYKSARIRRLGDLDDVRQVAYLALLDAVPRFDPSRGTKFSTFAIHWIRYRLLSASKNAGTIRVPAYQHDNNSRARRKQREKYAREIKRAFTIGRLPVNAFGQKMDPVDHRAVPDPAERETLEKLARLVARLPRREQEIIRARFGLDGETETLVQIGRLRGLTKERVRQIQLEALAYLREKMDSEAP